MVRLLSQTQTTMKRVNFSSFSFIETINLRMLTQINRVHRSFSLLLSPLFTHSKAAVVLREEAPNMATNEHSYSSSSLQGPSPSSPILQEKFPLGFHFKPYDWQLIMHYLFCHTHVLEPPQGINIPERNIYDHHPDELKRNFYNGFEGDMYFYTRRKFMGKRVERLVAGGPGFWKTTGNDENVKYEKDIVGIKKTFAFHEGKEEPATGWQMLEFRLMDTEKDGIVLCKIYKK